MKHLPSSRGTKRSIFALFLFSIVLLTACTKERTRSVKYQAQCKNCDITYSNAEGGTSTAYTAHDFEVELKIPEGNPMNLTACTRDTVPVGLIQVWAFVNGSHYADISAYCEHPDRCASFVSSVPEKE